MEYLARKFFIHRDLAARLVNGEHGGELNVLAQMPLLIKRTRNCEYFHFDDVTNSEM